MEMRRFGRETGNGLDGWKQFWFRLRQRRKTAAFGGKKVSTDGNIDDARAETIAELKASLAELEEGEGLTRFIGGHGLMSRVFEFTWRDAGLEINFRLPYGLVLADEEEQAADDAEIGAAIRMALLLLTVGEVKDDGQEGLTVSVWAVGDGVGYSIRDGNGDEVDAGDDWSGLVRRLETALPEGREEMAIIWP